MAAIDLFIHDVEYHADRTINDKDVVNAKLKDNAGRKGNKREEIKRGAV